ncbi:MAG: RES domain-containing protein [Myxococcota bacterium]|nr:RES domain-containing protein [Myxococcota bacterium]
MVGWRICKQSRVKAAFDGEGAARYPGRWNRKGVAVVYCASPLSLATLEYLVHLDPDEWPEDLVSICFEVPAAVAQAAEVVTASALPGHWRAIPGPDALKSIGSDWAKAGRSALLLVPSAVTTSETNVLLNPRHADLQRLVVHPPEPIVFDPRLRKA